ncbi:hypothetical protein C5167_051198 [Papaver somniferum]|uniref:Uncharacterized protein n=1 Tax=Papaver somniferum TaxID=3469 RepID=A0A4Y7KSC6_PAPSO|nr:hypothetical protein C5167_051198 [Papaver somniferum]
MNRAWPGIGEEALKGIIENKIHGKDGDGTKIVDGKLYLTWLMKIFGSWRRSTRRSGSLRACILGFRHLGGLTLNIFEASAFEGSVFTHLDAKPGMVVKGK